MTDADKQTIETLKQEYIGFLRQAETASECSNNEGMISAQRMMAANVSRRIVITEMRGEK